MRSLGRISRVGIAVVAACVLSGCGTSPSPVARTTAPSPSASPTPVLAVDLPTVPDEGVIVDVAGVATFRSLDGRRAVPFPGFHLDGGVVTGSRTWLVAADGSTWLLDAPARRLVRRPLGYQATDGLSLLHALPRPERIGHWSFALPGPSGRLLAQWSGECEIPTVYVVDSRHHVRRVGPRGKVVEAFARGWTRAGLPVIAFPEAGCAEGLPGPGLYVETAPGRYRLLVRAAEGAYYRLPRKASSTVVPLCDATAYRLVAVAEGATGDAALGAEVRPTSSQPCRLQAAITFVLRDAATGEFLSVPNNQISVEVFGQLPDADGVHADVIWHQPYCEHGDVDLVVHDDQGHESTARNVVRPRCDPAAGQSGRGPGLSVLR